MTVKLMKIIGDVLVSGLLLLAFAVGLFSSFDYNLQDVLFQRRAPISPDIIVIGIDEQTIAEFGMPPDWSRQIMADAVNILNSDPIYRPSVIGLDIMYLNEREDVEADQALVDAVKNSGNIVLAANVITGYVPSPANPEQAVRVAVEFERPFEALREHARYGSVNNVIFDSDSAVRRTSLWFSCDGEVMYSFPFEVFSKHIGGEGITFTPEETQDPYISYYGSSGLYKQLSFLDIFDESFDAAFIADRIVMIGAYAPGLLDAYRTSVRNEPMYGVEIQANIVQMLLDGNLKNYASRIVNFIILLSLILLAMFIAHFLSLRAVLIAYIGILLSYFAITQLIFNIGWSVTLAYPLVALLVIIAYQLIYGSTVNAIQVAELKSKLLQKENELMQNQVSVMLSQIRPHFLFNSLIAIQELCLTDAQSASETVTEFSKYLRHNIDSLSDSKPVLFEKELMHVEAYLSIEKKRFEEKLNVVYDISVRDFFIPALTLQPLVENAVRHGLTTRWQGGTVTISTKEIDGNIVISVTDDGVGFDTKTISENSTGIRNVRSRIATVCGGTLDIESKIGMGTTSIITIPGGGFE